MSHQSAHSPRPRPTVTINTKLEKRIGLYAAAAAGVSLLAASAAEAKVVYTPTNIKIGNPVLLDVDNNGVADFELRFFDPPFLHTEILQISPEVTGNQIRGFRSSAQAAFFGVPIGPKASFAVASTYFPGAGIKMAMSFQYSHTSFTGPWAGVTNRYLGLKFLINGETHYGWARMSVPDLLSAVITGYAYETVANKPIIAGHTSSSPEQASLTLDELAVPGQFNTLGMLARGTDAMPIWRRDNEVLS